jgi:hypothetical protein
MDGLGEVGMQRNILILIMAAGAAYPQQTATLTGFVSDSSAGNISGAKVTAVNTATQFVSVGVTNETGRFSIPYLIPGSYELKVEAAGFRTYVRTGIDLRAQESPRIDVVLELGTVSESINVSGAPPLLATETSTVIGGMSNQLFMRIPLLQMRTYNVMMYLPGVANPSEGSFFSLGQRTRSLGNTLDGVSVKGPVQGQPVGDATVLLTGADSLQEVRVLTTGVPAEFGGAGSGMIIGVMKSGTNQLHGSAEDRYLNKTLLHRRYFDQLAQPPFSYHDLTGTISGPVLLPKIYNGRDRTFFFFGWQRQNERASETQVSNVPSEAMYNGDFSFGGLGFPIYDPASTRQDASGTWVRDPFPGNRISPSLFDPVAKAFLSNNPWRPANQEGFMQATGPQQNLVQPTKNRSYRSRYTWKVDQQLSAAHKIFVRFTWNRHRPWSNRGNTQFAWELLNTGAIPRPTDMIGPAFSDTLTISPSTINEFRVAMTRYRTTNLPDSYGQGWAQKLGIPNVPPDTFPTFNGIGYTVGVGGRSQQVSENFTVSENLTKVMGRHTFKMGWDVVRSRSNIVAQDAPSGIYDFAGATSFPFRPNTGNGFAAFLLGAVQSAQFSQQRAAWLPRWWQHGLYFQDDFKPTRNLTLNLGVRWDYESPFQTKYGQQSQFDPAATDPITGRVGAITHPKGSLSKRDLNNFQPRLGLAWGFRKNMVFRSSFGVTTSELLAADTNVAFEEYAASANIQAPPGDPRIAFRLSQGPGTIPYRVNPDGTVPFFGTNFSGRQATWIDPNMRMPYIMNWAAGVQYQFARAWLLETSYQGASGVGLLNYWDINAIPLNISTDITVLNQIFAATQNYKPFPQFGQIRHYSNYGHNTYHAGTIRVEKRFSHGVTLNTFYTYAKALDDVDGESGVNGVDFYNRSLEKGVGGFDVTHRFVNVFTWDLPFGVGRRFLNKSGWRDKVFGGWMLTWADTLQSGRVFGVSFAGSPNRYLPGLSRPNILVPMDDALVDNWNIGPNRFPTAAQNPYLKASAFGYPAAYTAGTLGRNTFRGPLLYWPQAALAKQWSIAERVQFTIRVNSNNVVKRPQFSTPGSTYNTSNLGAFGTFTGVVGNFAGVGSQFHTMIVARLEF